MANLQNTETSLNLMRAFAGECQAYTRYQFFAAVAKKEGYKELEVMFNETAINEKSHAMIYMDLLYKGIGSKEASIPVNAEYPLGIGKTLDNLKHSAESEHDEHTNVYPHFAKVAEDEGFSMISHHFKMIAEIEAHHEQRFNRFAEQLGSNTLFSKPDEVYYRCIHCGHIHKATDAPKVCANCFHSIGYFEVVPYPSV
ncbi:MAG: hypothetical protein ATN36_00005 [Epulopiscium sp. Nele67-Bin005]|nr:MAG: hypothetical protein ATN36_00005 [Epulopiscium sp. Nele67-Bin005]